MADETLGGLGMVTAGQADAPEAAPAPAAPAAKPGLDVYLERVQKQQEESFAALDARRKKLLELGSARKNQMFDPQLLALSSALLKPTKTGNFGESLGNAAEALGGEQEKRMQREQAEAKMQMEIEQMAQDQKSKILEDQLVMSMFGGNKGAPVAGTPAGGAPAGATPTGGVESTGMLEGMTDQQLMILSRTNPKVATTALSILDNRRKAEELGLKKRETATKEASVKRFLPGVGAIEMPIDFWNKLESAKSFDEIAELYKSKNLPLNLTDTEDGGKRFMTSEEIEYEKEKKKAKLTEEPKKYTLPELGRGTYELLPSEYRDRQAAKAQGDQALQSWWDKNHPEFNVQIPGARRSGRSSGSGAPSEGVESTEQRNIKEQADIERGKQEAKADVEFGNNIMKEGTNAGSIRIISKNLTSVARSNPRIFDVMQDVNIGDALARTVKNGVSTPWGSVSIDPTDIYSAVDSYVQANPDKKLTKKDRDAYSMFLKDVAQLTILERRMSSGEGTISDKETGLFQQVNVMPSDSALAIRLKSELILERANAIEQIGNAFYKYKKQKGGTYEDFTHSSQYTDIKNAYESRLDRIRDANARVLGGAQSSQGSGQSAQGSSQSAPTIPQGNPPPISRLKEGQVTIFSNGQEWTLENGKPKRIK